MTYTATETKKPTYPCDICGERVESGERVHVTDNGLTVEHAHCASDWFRGNFGRESLS
jgi:hypothetical protein